jgi:hypothetical protein
MLYNAEKSFFFNFVPYPYPPAMTSNGGEGGKRAE